jgi:PAS domain S-box-containing protein
VSNYPIPHNEKQRLKALDSYNLLNSLSEAEYDRLTELASIICKVPIALISLIDEKRQWFKSKVGLAINETSRDLAFCQYAIMGAERFDVNDALLDDRFKDNDLVTGDPHIRFYSGQPLIDPDGFALGTICVIDRKPRVLTDAQKRALQILAQEAISLITERKQKHDLQYFEKLFQFSNDLICIAGTDGFFKKINGAFSKILGWDEDYILNTSSFEFVHPDDHELTKTELGKMASGVPEISFLQRIRTKSGGYRTIDWSGTPEGTTGNIFGVGRDITEEKNKEEQLAISEGKLRDFFDNSQGFMCTHDMGGKFLSINNSGADVLGYTKEEILEMSLFDIVPQARHPYIYEYLQTIRINGKASGQMTTLDKNGEYRIWMYTNVLEVFPNGEVYVIGNGSDVTERYQMQLDLERTKKILEQTNRVAHVGGWEFDLVNQKISWTEETKRIHGVPPDFEPDLTTGINFYKAGESRDAISKAITQAINKGIGFELELQIVRPNREVLWVKSIGNTELEDGHCKRIYGTFQDIDKQKSAELEVFASRRFMDEILHASSEVSIVVTDTEGLITVFNPGAEKILGFTADEMVSKQTTDIFRTAEDIAARKREIAETYGYEVEGFNIIAERARKAGSEQREWMAVKKDGTNVMVSSVVTPIRDEKNEIIGYLSIATDITEKKGVENALITEKARLSAFVEHAPAAIAMVDNDMNFIAASNVWLEYFSESRQAVTGKSYYDSFEPSPEMKERHQSVLNGATLHADEHIFRQAWKDEDIIISWEMMPWYLYDGKIGGLMVSVQDITVSVKRREELKAAILLAEQASVAKSEFLASMSHEIRTPLNGVIGFTDLVLKTKLNETQHQYLNIVNQSANALLSIINDILDFSKIEAGKLELDIEKCDLYELGCQATDIITYQVQTKGLEMLLNISSNLPRFIWADALRLKQVLINLLGNATKFTEKGEIELKITEVSRQDDIATVRFSVRDTGIGIKPEQQSKIFNAFSQEDASTTKKYGGTGLGLTISNSLLELMGSHLQLESAPGFGSTFYFDITLKTEEGTPIDWENIDLIKRVLIVDDNENNRMILTQMLLLKQIKTVEADNGFEALQLLAKGEHFDVVIMDYHMPHINGIETIQKIRDSFNGREKDIPVILLYSSSDDGAIIKACDELQIKHRLVKPVKMQDIYNTLSRLHVKDNYTTLDNLQTEITPISKNLDILIAEDNAVNMLLAKTILNRILPNAQIIGVETGTAAVAACKAQWPDLILMDVQMPEMNGYDATRQIRLIQAERAVPIIALTADNIKGEREKCLAAGMDDFATKPVVENTLMQLIQKWLPAEKSANIESKIIENGVPSTHLDLNAIKALTGDDDNFIKEVLSLTKIELTASLKTITQQINKGDLKGINLSGHKLNGTALSAGLPVLAKMASRLEHTAHFDKDELTQLLAAARDEITAIFMAMEKHNV